MSRKKRTVEDTEPAPMDKFQDAVKKVLNTPKEIVDEQIFEFQSSNKAKRLAKKQEPDS